MMILWIILGLGLATVAAIVISNLLLGLGKKSEYLDKPGEDFF